MIDSFMANSVLVLGPYANALAREREKESNPTTHQNNISSKHHKDRLLWSEDEKQLRNINTDSFGNYSTGRPVLILTHLIFSSSWLSLIVASLSLS
jgi:hypothetical protein